MDGNMKKPLVIAMFIVILFSLIFGGCAAQKDYEEFKQMGMQCLKKYKNELLEVFTLCKNKDIVEITEFDDNAKNKGRVIEYNDNKYSFYLSNNMNDNISDVDTMRVCEIFETLKNEYQVYVIYCYSYMELLFKESYFNVNWGIVYYPPDVEPPENIDNEELYEEIGDGFYYNLSLPG